MKTINGTAAVGAPASSARNTVKHQSSIVAPLLVVLGFAMTIVPYAVVSTEPGVWQFGATLAFVDFVALVIAVLAAPRLAHRIHHRLLHPIEWAGLSLLFMLVITFGLHPSMRGVVLVVRFACCLATSDLIATTTRHHRMLLLKTLAAASGIQSVIAVSQRITGSAIGLGVFGETSVPFRTGYLVPTGTMRDAYPLAAFGIFVAAIIGIGLSRQWISGWLPWVGIVSGGILAGLSGSRTALLTLTAVCVALGISRSRRGFAAALVLGVGFVGCAGLSSPLWLRRTTNISTSSGGVAANDVTNGRSALTQQAIGLIQLHPIIGVGPGNYSAALRATPELARRSPENRIQPVHNMVLMAVSESGLLIVPALVWVFATIGWMVIRRRRWTLPLFAAIGPFLMLDLVFWFYPEGLLMIAIAIGFAISQREIALSTDQ